MLRSTAPCLRSSRAAPYHNQHHVGLSFLTRAQSGSVRQPCGLRCWPHLAPPALAPRSSRRIAAPPPRVASVETETAEAGTDSQDEVSEAQLQHMGPAFMAALRMLEWPRVCAAGGQLSPPVGPYAFTWMHLVAWGRHRCPRSAGNKRRRGMRIPPKLWHQPSTPPSSFALAPQCLSLQALWLARGPVASLLSLPLRRRARFCWHKPGGGPRLRGQAG